MDTPLPEPVAVHAWVSAGVGFPELLHAEGGVFVIPRLAVGARLSSVLLNTEVGVEATGLLLGTPTGGRPPRHALTVSGQAMFNPTLSPIRLGSGGDALAAYAAAYIGYAWHSDVGFTLGVQGGALVYAEDGVAVGPNATIAAGWTF